MTTRITVTTPVPANTEVADARRAARLQACEAFGIHIVEETLLPLDEPADPTTSLHSVDRVLTTVWDVVS